MCTGLIAVARALAELDAGQIGIERSTIIIARLAEHDRLPPNLDPDYVARNRAFIAAQPGFCGLYHLLDAETGRALSLTLWQDEAALAAAQRVQGESPNPAGGPITYHSKTSVRIIEVVAIF